MLASDLPRPAQPAQVLPSLVRLGLSPTADLIYRFLHSHDRRTAPAIARNLGLSQGTVAAHLEELRAAGFVTELGSPAHPAARAWRATPAADALLAMKARRRVRPGPASRFTAVTGAVGESIPLGPGVAHLTSRESSRLRMGALIEVARHEFLALHPEPVFEESAMRAASPTDRRITARGVHARTVGVHPKNLAMLAPYGVPADPRVGYREASRVSMKLFVLDRRVALIPVDPGNYERGYLEITQPAMVASLLDSFERHWGEATDPAVRAVAAPVVTARESALLDLLIQGHTDVTAARQLQISARSVSNILRAMMDRFGVQNRFQLGIVLGSAHAITLPPHLSGLLQAKTTAPTQE